MKNTRKNGRGFSLVELVIVIAVIAILAAVLIPTFGGIIRRAQESKALQEVTSAYKATLADDIINNTKIVYGREVVVMYGEYNKPIYIKVTTDGKASVLENSEEPTHFIENGKLVLEHEHAYKLETITPTCTSEGYTTYTCTMCGYSKIGNKVSATDHLYTYGYSNGEHYKRCMYCNLRETTNDHTYVADKNTGEVKCECGEEKLFVFYCLAVNPCDYYHEYTMTEIKNLGLEKCIIGNHDPKDYVCPDCGGCLREACDHSFKTYIRVDGTYHASRCEKCYELIQSEHTRKYGDCSLCGNHTHNKAEFIPIGDNTRHSVTCDFCDEIVLEGHSINISDVDITLNDDSGHTATCRDCKASVFVAHTEEIKNSKKCAICLFQWCTHPNGTYYVDLEDGTHQHKCDGVSGPYGYICDVQAEEPEAHILDENGKCTLCPYNPECKHEIIETTNDGPLCKGCSNYVFKIEDDNSGFTKTLQEKIVYNADNIVYFSNINGTATFNKLQIGRNGFTVKSVTIDLQGGTLELTGALQNYVKKLVIRNGTIITNNTIQVGAYEIVLEDVDVIKTGSGNGLFIGQNKTNIKITNGSTIDVSGATNKRVAYFHATYINNVNIEIADSTITCGDGGYLVYFYSATQSEDTMKTNSVTVTNTTVNGDKVESPDNVREEYVFITDGEKKEQYLEDLNVSVQ